MYYCLGCGVDGDVFSFVMAIEKCEFPEALRTVAEKCGIPIPALRALTPGEKQANQQRGELLEMHREAAAFFAQQLESTAEGRAAHAYLEDRGLDREAIAQFGLGYAPSSGEALCRHLSQKHADQLLELSGLVSRDPGGRLYDRFRRRIMFPIASESGKGVAFGGRAGGDDFPQYIKPPGNPLYLKRHVPFPPDRAEKAVSHTKSALLG